MPVAIQKAPVVAVSIYTSGYAWSRQTERQKHDERKGVSEDEL